MRFKFICSICGREHLKFFDAWKCERRGKPNINDIPIGLMYEYHHDGFVGIFAISDIYSNRSHYIEGSTWACRPRGDTLGDQHCRMHDFYTLDKYKKQNYITKWGTQQPEFQRMCLYLKDQGITPSYYDEDGNFHSILGQPKLT